jgi:hypothetical protein
MQHHALTTTVLMRIMQAASLNQRGLASLLGVSDRSITRWMGGVSGILMPAQLQAAAKAVYAKDPALATDLAQRGGTTLEALGLVKPPPPPPPPPAPPLPPPHVPAALLDSIVCAAAEVNHVAPREVRPIVVAAILRAADLGLTIEALARTLKSMPVPAPATGPAERPATTAPKAG